MRNNWSFFALIFISKSGIEFSLKIMFHINFIFSCFSCLILWRKTKRSRERFSLFYVIFNFKAFPFILNFYSLGKEKRRAAAFFFVRELFDVVESSPSLKFNLWRSFLLSLSCTYIHIYIVYTNSEERVFIIVRLMLMIW